MSLAARLKQEVRRRLTIWICCEIEKATFANGNNMFLHPVSEGRPFASTARYKIKEGSNNGNARYFNKTAGFYELESWLVD